MTHAPKQNSPWIPCNSVPKPLETPQFVMEPLDEKHSVLDFEALMSCRVRLREELQWGKWPPEDFSLDLNRTDLRHHHDEYIRREAFAYTVLKNDRSRCLGCVYIERCAEIESAQIAFWVIDDAIDIEEILVTEVLRWVHRSWSMNRVMIPLRETNSRGIALARKCGFTEWSSVKDGPLSDHRCFLSELESV
jgi:RimJ/RimL family protein N-acetyltransferase